MRITASLVCCLSILLPCSVHGQDVRVEQDPGRGAVLVTVAAPLGIVEWRDVAKGIAEAEGLDEAAVAGLLPNGTLDLDSAAAQWIVGGLRIALLGSGLRPAIRHGTGEDRALLIEIDRTRLRGTLNMLKGVARQVVVRWDDREDSRYGLSVDEDWRRFGAQRPLVVIIHGYSSQPEEFATLHDRLRQAGFAGALFAYPNDASITSSGQQLAAALRELERLDPGRSVSLVAHSMGGLVARVAVEDPVAGGAGNAGQLVMVATPNRGSNLARVPVSLDAWEHWLGRDGQQVKTVFFDSVLDGLNEARHDLQPDSALLERLNGLPRNNEVRYSLLLGNEGPATREQLDELRRLLRSAESGNTLLRALGPRLEELLADLDELVDGRGDGAVAVERGRLDGVDDTLVLAFSHGTITSNFSDDGARALLREIVARLNRAEPAG